MVDDTAPLVLAFGDSLTAGYGLARDEAFPARLEALLRETTPRIVVQNAGVSGDTSGSALARLPRLLSGLDRRPNLAIVELGANDLIRRIPPAQTRANLDAILTEFGRCGIATLLATFEPPPFLHSLAGDYAGIYEGIAARHDAVAHPFFPPGVLGHHAHVLRDRLHPNALAIDKVARAMAPVAQQALDRATRCR